MVDDHPAFRRAVTSALNLVHDVEVVGEAAGGDEGARAAVASDADLVLMDLSMPGVDGYDAIRSIRGRQEFARLPIIAITAFDRADSRDGAAAAGCDHFLSKPIDFQRLEVLVEKLTRSRRADTTPAS